MRRRQCRRDRHRLEDLLLLALGAQDADARDDSQRVVLTVVAHAGRASGSVEADPHTTVSTGSTEDARQGGVVLEAILPLEEARDRLYALGGCERPLASRAVEFDRVGHEADGRLRLVHLRGVGIGHHDVDDALVPGGVVGKFLRRTIRRCKCSGSHDETQEQGGGNDELTTTGHSLSAQQRCCCVVGCSASTTYLFIQSIGISTRLQHGFKVAIFLVDFSMIP